MTIRRHTSRSTISIGSRVNSAQLLPKKSGFWSPSAFTLRYAVAGGGGGSGGSGGYYGQGGAGGAGGLVLGNVFLAVSPTTPQTFTITIGAGGGAGYSTSRGSSGSPTTLAWGANTITGLGGGGGGSGAPGGTLAGFNGGSGGGGQAGGSGTQPVQPTSPTVTYQGGYSGGPIASGAGGGGGGAGGDGAGGVYSQSNPNGKYGGEGFRWFASGQMYSYGGNVNPSGTYTSGTAAIPGPPGTGNGGGGNAGGLEPAGNGGSGAVVIAIPTDQYQFLAAGSGGPASAPVSTNGDLTYVTFAAPGTFTMP